MKVSNYISYLSQLIYDSQLMILQHCLNQIVLNKILNMSDCLIKMCNHWILNNSLSLITELLFLCLLDNAIAKNTVNQT